MQKDKLYHFGVSFAITLILSFIIGYLWAVVLTVAIGVGKELWDYFVKDNFSKAELYADTVGIFFGLVVFTILKASIL